MILIMLQNPIESILCIVFAIIGILLQRALNYRKYDIRKD